jgi:hypothetical protein
MAERDEMADVIYRCDVPQFITCARPGLYEEACKKAAEHLRNVRPQYEHLPRSQRPHKMLEIAVDYRNRFFRERLGLPWYRVPVDG